MFLILLISLFILVVVLYLVIKNCKGTSTELFTTIPNPNQERSTKMSTASFFSPDKLSSYEKLQSLYSPIIIRPRENVSLNYTSECSNVLYPKATSPFGKGEMGSPNPYVEAQYYAQRPILNPDTYEKLLDLLFNKMNEDAEIKKPPKNFDSTLFVHPTRFCQDNLCSDSKTGVLKFIMDLIRKTLQKVPPIKSYSKVDTWGGEQFSHLDERIFSFSRYDNSMLSDQEQARIANTQKEPQKVVVNFNLYNTLRSVSTNVTAIVIYFKGKYYLKKIRKTTESPNEHTGIEGVNVNTSVRTSSEFNRSPVPKWIYGNTIENKFFNSKGFHDPNQPNIYIKGGVPDEFKEILEEKEQAYLSFPYNAQNLKGGPQNFSMSANQLNSKIMPEYPEKNPTWSVNV